MPEAEKAAPEPTLGTIKLRRRPVVAKKEHMGYRQVNVDLRQWMWQGNVSYVPMYCGAKFWWDFQTNYAMSSDLRQYMQKAVGNELPPSAEKKVEHVTPQAEQMYRAIMYAMMVEHIDSVVGEYGSRDTHHPIEWGYYADNIRSKMDMDFSFWEVDYRPMYAFALYHGFDMLPPRTNPNSWNTASFFAGPPTVDVYLKLYDEFKDTLRVEWVDSLHEDIPDIDDGNPFDDEDIEEW